MNNTCRFGIISGAGPMAGALLYQRVIEKLQREGACRDADFPTILLLNYPFSEMLSEKLDNNKVREELITALSQVSKSVDHVYIACQTLHGFLEAPELDEFKVVSLLALTKQAIGKNTKNIAVVASRTSRHFALHPKYLELPCEYVECDQSEVAIDAILSGKMPDLTWFEMLSKKHRVILGCTEFSVALQKSIGDFIDPIELAADDIVRKFILHRFPS